MTRLHDLSTRCAQSPWVDNVTRAGLLDGSLTRRIEAGVRGLTSNPSIFQVALAGSDAYDQQIADTAPDKITEDMYWNLVLDDIRQACNAFTPLYASTQGDDGYVSVEVSPRLARDHAGTTYSALALAEAVHQPNVMIKIPATLECLGAVSDVLGNGINVNVTLIFTIARYESVMESYIEGLERYAEHPDADLAGVRSVASFFVSRVDTAVDAELARIGTPAARALQGKTAVAQARLAYEAWKTKFSGERWEALATKGARVQRPLWASTSTKNPNYPDLLYVDSLIAPNTVNTMPEAVLDNFLDHGNVNTAFGGPDDTCQSLEAAIEHMAAIAGIGIDMHRIGKTLEEEGLAAFQNAYDGALAQLEKKRSAVALSR